MSKLREAARRALTALNIFHGAVTDTDWKMDFQPEIDALRAVLAEPEEDGWRRCAEGQGETQYCGLLEAAVLAEREACARLVENYAGAWDDEGFALAQEIRERGEK